MRQNGIRYNNRSAILKLLNDQGPMSRKDIALSLGLTTAAVTQICSEWISAGVLLEKGELQEEEKRAGRRKILLDINHDKYTVLSVSIEQEMTWITLSNLRGDCAAAVCMETDAKGGAEPFLRKVADSCGDLLKKNRGQSGSILGVGVSVPGFVDRSAGTSSSFDRVWDGPVDICGILSSQLKLPVILENNVKAFAEAELIFGSGRQYENIVFVKWGPGVGSAIVLNKQIYESRRRKEAEIAHLVAVPDGKRCRCGRRGCLEAYVSTHALAEQVRARYSRQVTPELFAWSGGDVSRVTARSISEWTKCGDPALWEVLDGNICLMARIVTNMLTILSPDQTIIYGRMFDLPSFQDRFIKYCEQFDCHYADNKISRSKLKERITYAGPLALVVNEFFLSGHIAI